MLLAGEIQISGFELAAVIVASALSVIALPLLVVLVFVLIRRGSLGSFSAQLRSVARRHRIAVALVVVVIIVVIFLLGLWQGGLSAGPRM